ncbi:hypothetical protein IWW34DRAFT_222952 [Fusarium oxysporum f. sp. albedinis]|nr:hypothetical protein IWW34DRAFT_222952 [Fusarium oxysporum f. sp. albedinis]
MANNTLLDNLQLFFDTSARLLICTRETCKFALSNGPSRVTTHLRDKHNISTEARKGLNQLLKYLSPAPYCTNYPPYQVLIHDLMVRALRKRTAVRFHWGKYGPKMLDADWSKTGNAVRFC